MEQTRMEQQNTEQTTLSSYNDPLIIGDHTFTSCFILGSGRYSLDLIQTAVKQAEAQIIILTLRWANEGGIANVLGYTPNHITLLPNIPNVRNAQEVARIARLSRKTGCEDFVRIEVIRDAKYLLPNNTETIKTTEILAKEGSVVMPCMYPDLNAARDLASAGATYIMPSAAPIGTSRGLCTKEFIQVLINEIDLPIIVDTGIERPSQACEAMGMDTATIMTNTAITITGNIPTMAGALKLVIEAGRQTYLAGLGRTLDKEASASPPLTGFLHD